MVRLWLSLGILGMFLLVGSPNPAVWASHQEVILWDQAYRDNLSIQMLQKRVTLALESSVEFLAYTIDAQLEFGEAEPEDDYTLNGTIAYVYHNVEYRLRELGRLYQRVVQALNNHIQELRALQGLLDDLDLAEKDLVPVHAMTPAP